MSAHHILRVACGDFGKMRDYRRQRQDDADHYYAINNSSLHQSQDSSAARRMPAEQQQPPAQLMGHLMHQICYDQHPDHRVSALRSLRRLLSTPDDACSMHHLGLDQQLDRKLSWQLSYDLQQQQQQSAPVVAVIAGICDCLLLLWTGSSPDRREQSFLQLVDFVPWYLHAWKTTFDDAAAYNEHCRGTQQSILQILRLWSQAKNPTLKNILLRSDLIACLRQFWSASNNSDTLRPTLLAIIKDLSSRASDKDKKYLYRHLLDVILECCRQDSSLKMTDTASRVLWNWATVEHVGLSLAESSHETWEALQYMLRQMSTKLDKQHDASALTTIRRQAMSVVGTMVAAWTSQQQQPPALLLQQSWLLPCLLTVLQLDNDADTRRRSIRTIRCLATCAWGRDFIQSTAETDSDPLSHILVRILSNSLDGSDVQCQVYQTISALLSHDPSFETWQSLHAPLQTALLRTLEDPPISAISDKLILAACDTIRVFLIHCRPAHFELPDKLLRCVQQVLERNVSEAIYQVQLSELLLYLATDAPCAADSILTTPYLDSLSILMGSVGPETQAARANAIDIVLHVIENPQSKKPMADNDRLLTSLVNFCLVHSGPQKQTVKQVILKLVPEL